ncbi:MAG: addiction module protein [Spirochaetia bacterium]|jgi:putative addiction module component (TIGR02574 family)|nr:addiction module protein [Spirochaetia bacterium]
MQTSDILKEINNLDLSEKLILVEDVWDSIARFNAELPLPEWQKSELDKRYSDYQNGELKLHDWEDVHENLRNKYK